MKTIVRLVLVTVAVFGADLAYAQGFGIKGGINSSTITGNPAPLFEVEFSSRIAGVGGISWAAPLSRRASLQIEALYFRRDAEGEATGAREFGFMRAHYIDVPLLLVYDLSEGDSRVNLQTGPEVAFKIGESGAFEVAQGQGIDDLTQELAKTLVGWAFGLGLESDTGDGTFTVDARYILGFTDVFAGDPRKGRRWSTFVVLGGYVF